MVKLFSPYLQNTFEQMDFEVVLVDLLLSRSYSLILRHFVLHINLRRGWGCYKL